MRTEQLTGPSRATSTIDPERSAMSSSAASLGTSDGAPLSAPVGAPVAQVTDLRVSLIRDGARREVLRGIDLDIARGEIVGLVGESGSGKSVLALSLLGLLPAASRPETSGRVSVAGVDMLKGQAAEVRRVRRTELGAIFQDPMSSLNPTMRIGRQLTEV